MARIYGNISNISCPACLQILPTAVLRGFWNFFHPHRCNSQGLMCQPLTGRSSGRRRFLKLGEVWESFAGNQFSLNYQIFLYFLPFFFCVSKRPNESCDLTCKPKPIYWWNRRGTMPHFWNYEINSEKLTGAHGKKYPYTIPCVAKYGALVHKPRCALLRTTTRSACSSWLAPKRICSQRRQAQG